jgi:hypothetical protein
MHYTKLTSIFSIAFSLACGLLGACQNYPWIDRPNQRVSSTVISEIILKNSNTDILFVIDNSGSMNKEQENLEKNTKSFIEFLAASDNNYRVGIVTTDPEGPFDSGRLRLDPASEADLEKAECGEIAPNTSNLKYLVRPTPNTATTEKERCRLVQDFVNTVSNLNDPERAKWITYEYEKEEEKDGQTVTETETAPNANEAGLLVSKLAVDNATALNSDFIRQDADLALIFLTDEEDCSFEDYSEHDRVTVKGQTGGEAPYTSAACYYDIFKQVDDNGDTQTSTRLMPPLAIPVQTLVDDLIRIKGTITKVRAAGIIGGIVEASGEFKPTGCHLDISTGLASANCGCWQVGGPFTDIFCRYLNEEFDPVCETSCNPSPCTIKDDACPLINVTAPDGSVEEGIGQCVSVAGEACDTTICDALPGKRYHDFLQEIGTRRATQGFEGGIFVDSICKADYGETLINIAKEVVLSQCFALDADEESQSGGELIELSVTREIDASKGPESFQIPWLDATDPKATCSSCDECKVTDSKGQPRDDFQGAFSYPDSRTICLVCQLEKQTGDGFSLTVFNDISGFDG